MYQLFVAIRVQLQQVILNLILNAIEAMNLVPTGPGSLTVSSAKTDSNGVLISVQDSGAGFEKENRDRLFNAFYTTKPGGMGMGLAISRSIVRITAEHMGDTKFTAWCGLSIHFANWPGVECMMVNNDKPVVFVVDDDPHIREALDGLIRSIQLNVQTFGTTEEFLDFKRPDAPVLRA